MAEKIERMELDSESKDKVCFVKIKFSYNFFPGFHVQKSENFVVTCDQQLMELQELYNSQLLLTAELTEKLENTEVQIFGWSTYGPSPSF